MANYNLNMNGQFINNCLDPAQAQDVATRSYVDKRAVAYTAEGQIQYAGPSPFLPTTLSVGANGEVLTLAGTPLAPTWAPPTGGGGANTATYLFYVGDPSPSGSSTFNLNTGAANYDPLGTFYPISPVTPVLVADPTITFDSSTGTQLEYTGPGTIQVSMSVNSLPLEYQIQDATSTPVKFTDTYTNPYYQAGIQFLAIKNGVEIVGSSPMMNQGAVVTDSLYIGSFSCSFTLTNNSPSPNDMVTFTPITNAYFNRTSTPAPGVPEWLTTAGIVPPSTYKFVLTLCMIRINCVRMN